MLTALIFGMLRCLSLHLSTPLASKPPPVPRRPPTNTPHPAHSPTTELIEEEPWSGQRKAAPQSVPAAGAGDDAAGGGGGGELKAGDDGEDASSEGGRPKKGKATLGALRTTSIRLNNNEFETCEGLGHVLGELMAEPLALNWIDLSFNKLTSVEEQLTEYTDLGVVYLHVNCIEKISQLRMLRNLPNLRKLTLHGNPVEETKNYRYHVIEMLPTLKELDFTPITKLDRAKAKSWREIHKKKRAARERD